MTDSEQLMAQNVAADATIARAIKASGAIVRLDPNEFLKILKKTENPLVVKAPRVIWFTSEKYLTSYKGLIFYCCAKDELLLPKGCEVVTSDEIWVP